MSNRRFKIHARTHPPTHPPTHVKPFLWSLFLYTALYFSLFSSIVQNMSIEEQVSTEDMFQMCISYNEINNLYVYLQRVKHLYGTCRSTCCQKKKKKLPSVCGVFIISNCSCCCFWKSSKFLSVVSPACCHKDKRVVQKHAMYKSVHSLVHSFILLHGIRDEL